MSSRQNSGWIAVDLDGTLAYYEHGRGPDHIGAPIPAMLERVKQWLLEGRDVRIFTARISNWRGASSAVERRIKQWCKEHLGCEIPITCEKDLGMIELWDDRCVQVITNTGKSLADEFAAERSVLRGRSGMEDREPRGESDDRVPIGLAHDEMPAADAQETSGVMIREARWQYCDLPRVSIPVFKQFVAMAGAENIRLLSLTSGPDWKRGQLFISPKGLSNLRGSVTS